MDAKKCDRCGSFYDKFALPNTNFLLSKYCNNGRQDLTRVMDLCPECQAAIGRWMENKAEIIVIDIDEYLPKYEGAWKSSTKGVSNEQEESE